MADPKIVQRGAMVLEMQPGKYAWCACGESKNQYPHFYEAWLEACKF